MHTHRTLRIYLNPNSGKPPNSRIISYLDCNIARHSPDWLELAQLAEKHGTYPCRYDETN